jgi:hypothetical protein
LDATLEDAERSQFIPENCVSLRDFVARFRIADGTLVDLIFNRMQDVETLSFLAADCQTQSLSDLITVRSGLLEIGNKSLRIIHEMRHDSSGELAACMVAVGVCVDGSTRRSRPLPDDVRMRARLKTHAPAERQATNSVSKITAESEDRPASAASRANRNLVGEILEAMFCPMEIVR